MNVLLRTLTEKSIIGFGNYQRTTVGYLIERHRYKELIQLYYNLEKITYSPDILKLLFLDGEFGIHKPGKDYEKYKRYADMLCVNIEFIQGAYRKTEADIYNPEHSRKLLDPRARNSFIGTLKDMSKMRNKMRNQKA